MGSVTRITKKSQFQICLLLILLAIVGTHVGCDLHVPLIQPKKVEEVSSSPIPHSGQASEPADTTGAANESGAQESVTRVTDPSSTELETRSQDPSSTSNHEPPGSSTSGTSLPYCTICLEEIIERPTSTTAHEQPVTADIENQSTSSNGGQVGNEHVVTVSNHQYPSILTRIDETSHTIPDPDAMVQLVCSHLFHEKCIIDWFTKNTDQPCPICRGTGTLTTPVPTFSTWCREMRERARRRIITPIANRCILFEESLVLAMMGTTMDRLLSEDEGLMRFRDSQQFFRAVLTAGIGLFAVFMMVLELFIFISRTSTSPPERLAQPPSFFDARGPSGFPF